jgi:predicted TIM-barrel fold metal-dependent hydrolase
VSSQWVPWVVHEAVRRSLGSLHVVTSDCLRQYNIYVSTQSDDDFAYIISYAGEDNLVIGTDYGHGDTSSELNAIARFKALDGLNDRVKRKILSDNPRRFYGI